MIRSADRARLGLAGLLAALAGLAACSSSCPQPAAAAGAASASSAELDAPELLSRAETLASAVCDCPSALCADAEAANFVDLLRDRGENLGAESRDKLLALAEKVLGCRVRLAYPSEPVDMDGAAEPPDPGDGDDSSGDDGSASDAGAG